MSAIFDFSVSRRSVALAFTALALTFAAPSTQAATAVWTPEKVLAQSPLGVRNVNAAVNVSGRAVVFWNKITGSDPAHPYGILQVFAGVRASNVSPWSRAKALSPADASHCDAVVDPASGKVTVFWTAAGVSYASTSADSGISWTTETIPTDAGYSLFTTPYGQTLPLVGVDGAGNITIIVAKPNGLNTYDLQAMVKSAGGSWSAPVALATATLFGSARLHVLSDGQALLNFGFTTIRRDSAGTWGPAQIVNIGGYGQVFSASADIDAGGKGYFVFRTHYGGAFLSTSTPGTAWTKPKHLAKVDILGSSLQVTGSSAGHAILYGNDFNTGAVRATATGDGSLTWGPLYSFGFGDYPQAAGSENGLYAIGWSAGGAGANRYFVASGTGIGTATTAWLKSSLSGGFPLGTAAVAGTTPGGTAQAVAGWERQGSLGNVATGAVSGTIGP